MEIHEERIKILEMRNELEDFLNPDSPNRELWDSRQFKVYGIPPCDLTSIHNPVFDSFQFVEPLPKEYAILRRDWDFERNIIKFLIYGPEFKPMPLGMQAKIIVGHLSPRTPPSRHSQ